MLVHNSCRNKGGRLGNQATREQNKLNEPKIILIPKGDGIGDLISELEKRGLI